MSQQEFSFYCAACGYVDMPIFRKNEKRMQTCPECGSRRIKKAQNNLYGNPILPVKLQFKKKENENMNQETVTIKMKDERKPEEVMRNKAKIEHQEFECENCNEMFEIDDLHPLYRVDGTKEHEHVCEKCEDILKSEDEPIATVIYGVDDGEPKYIRSYSDDTEGDFKATYHRTDGWRGYYDITSDKWSSVHSDCILAYSQDSAELEKFDTEFRETLGRLGIPYARVTSRTSNLFSSGYDFFVEKGKETKAEAVRVVLAAKYRDPERFRATALTGKDNLNEHDKLFVKAVELLEKGMDPEDAVKAVMDEKEERCIFREDEVSFSKGTALDLFYEVLIEKTLYNRKSYHYLNGNYAYGESEGFNVMDWTGPREDFFKMLNKGLEQTIMKAHKFFNANNDDIMKFIDTGGKLLLPQSTNK